MLQSNLYNKGDKQRTFKTEKIVIIIKSKMKTHIDRYKCVEVAQTKFESLRKIFLPNKKNSIFILHKQQSLFTTNYMDKS